MSTASTGTKTFTKADVRKVVESFAADYAMIGDVTGLRTRATVENDVADLNKFAEDGYLVRATLYLMDKDGNPLNVAVYEVSNNAIGWQTGMPGNNLWTAPAGSYLQLTATMTDAWFKKPDADQATYHQDRGIVGSWAKSDKHTSLAGLTSNAGQKYASNGYGWARTNYSK